MNGSVASPGGPDGFADVNYLHGMERLVHAVQELSLTRSLVDVQGIVRRSARQLVGCDGTTFVLRDREMCYYADEDAIAPLWKGSRFPMRSCISGWTMLNRAAAIIPDIYLDARIPHEAYRPTFVKSLVMVPIRTIEPVGAIGAYWATPHHATIRQVALLQALADSTSIAMENVQVYAELEQRVRDRTAELEKVNNEIRLLSVTDDLTGLSNRRGLYLLADSALQSASRNGHGCLLAYIDVDGLKQINDRHGHEAGDLLIADVAAVLRTELGGSAVIARVGGDEFCVLISDQVADPLALRGQIDEAFRRFNVGSHGRPYLVSASIGLAQSAAGVVCSVDELLSQADEMMYRDKRTRADFGAGA